MTTRHGLVSNWSHFFQEVPLAWHGLVRFPEEKNHPKNLGMLKKDSELIYRSENCVFEKVLVIIYCIYLFFFRKRCFKRFWEKKLHVTME